jgi:hypothetical protein
MGKGEITMETVVIALIVLVVAGILVYLATRSGSIGVKLLECKPGEYCVKTEAECSGKGAGFLLSIQSCKPAGSKENDGYCCAKPPYLE